MLSLVVCRRALLLGTALGAAAACGRGEPEARAAPFDPAAYRVAERYEDSLIALARGDASSLSDESVVVVGYAEQLRLGFGSPFYLVERAATDPRLGADVRLLAARALLTRTGRGFSYATAIAVERAHRAAGTAWPAAERGVDEGLIGRVVSAAPDPQVGERAVRLAYALSAAAGVAGAGALSHAAESAALWRDRALAAADVRELLRGAYDGDVDALLLLTRWRATRRFAVEVPPLAAAPGAADAGAVPLALDVADSLAAGAADVATERSVPSDAAPLLGPRTARRWAALARARAAPPHAAIVVELRALRSQVLGGAAGRQARVELLREATDEETLAAQHARVWWAGAANVGLARALRRVAVALRAYAQEPIDAGGTAAVVETVRRRHGLAELSFDTRVPSGWRVGYARVLDRALTDTRRVLPALDVRGLRVRFGNTPLGDLALAMHEPTRRTLFLPPETASGTLAHEFAHDLDWSAITRGDYSTDQAIRDGEERLVAALSRLGGDSLVSPGPENQYRVSAAIRPTEVFARAFDWFIASSLASQGRSNGHLSAVQDDLLATRVGAVAPDRAGFAAMALMDVLEEMTRVPPAMSGAFMARHGPGHPITAWEAVLGVMDVAPPTADETAAGAEALSVPAAPFGAPGSLSFGAGWCRTAEASDAAARRWPLVAARAAASARARGIVARWARQPVRPGVGGWRRALAGAPWSPNLRLRMEEHLCDVLLARWSASTVPRFFTTSGRAATAAGLARPPEPTRAPPPRPPRGR